MLLSVTRGELDYACAEALADGLALRYSVDLQSSREWPADVEPIAGDLECVSVIQQALHIVRIRSLRGLASQESLAHFKRQPRPSGVCRVVGLDPYRTLAHLPAPRPARARARSMRVRLASSASEIVERGSKLVRRLAPQSWSCH